MAQIFTLIHEYAHVWLGITGVSDIETTPPDIPTEGWCNSVAAGVLVPMEELHRQRQPEEDLQAEISRLGRLSKAGSLVILRRLFDAGRLDRTTYRDAYDAELARLMEMEPPQSRSGENFYNTTLVRTGHRFDMAVLGSAWEGRTSFTEAMQMLGVKSMDTLRSMSRRLAVYG
jgi:Zn-dependent peptidase ImmA (M78 family)